MENTVNSTGNMVYSSQNARSVFDADRLDNVKFGIITLDMKDAMDVYHVGFNCELAYECHAIVRSSNVLFTHLSYDNTGIQYCDSCHNSDNLFGCCGVRKGSYMILNKKYSKDDYHKLREKIIEHMKKTGEYGEFFPIRLSPFSYNESHAGVYMPLSREEVLSKGFNWEDDVPGTYGKETVLPEDIPDDISSVPDLITKEILKCENCGKNYNIVPAELIFYKRESIPIPHCCFNCRYRERIAARLPRKLWHRKCMKENCQNEFETSYAPDRSEKIYCNECYQREVYW